MTDNQEMPAFLAGGPTVEGFAPGRTELAGNHLDHQGGTVLAGAITQGIHGYAAPNGTDIVRIESEGFEPFELNLAHLKAAPGSRAGEAGLPIALVRGMLCQLLEDGAELVGFDARLSSNIPCGGGLSSSAAFEMIIGRLACACAGVEQTDPVRLASFGQIAESEYYGKPCGLMDQTAIALGGIHALDFFGHHLPDFTGPAITEVDFNFDAAGIAVVLVDVGEDHAGSTADFADIPQEMTASAMVCGKAHMGQVSWPELMDYLPLIRQQLGDRAALRAMHFIRENDLVHKRIAALQANDIPTYLNATHFSGDSSIQYLQNISVPGSASQPAMVAIGLANCLLDLLAEEGSFKGVCRIHGGGFGGTIQAYLPAKQAPQFIGEMEQLLGAGCCNWLEFSKEGAWARSL